MNLAVPKTLKPILLVEDNEDDVFFMKRAVEHANLLRLLQIVSHGRDAVDYLTGAGTFTARERFPLPGLIFLDLKLPYLSGLEVLEWIRTQSPIPHVPILILTSSRQPRDIETAKMLGANSYLVKPASSEQLEETIKAVREYWCRYDQFYLSA